jgi:hypothetical protein
MGEPEINAFLTHLALTEKVSASTQTQALSALRFLDRDVLSLGGPRAAAAPGSRGAAAGGGPSGPAPAFGASHRRRAPGRAPADRGRGPPMSCTASANWGSLERLNCSTRRGRTACRCQTRWTIMRERPSCWARVRTLQRVPAGGASSGWRPGCAAPAPGSGPARRAPGPPAAASGQR